jgi:hypothetical protein
VVKTPKYISIDLYLPQGESIHIANWLFRFPLQPPDYDMAEVICYGTSTEGKLFTPFHVLPPQEIKKTYAK